MNGETHEAPPTPEPPRARSFDWRPLVWVLVGVTGVLLLASLFGSGTGLFGWGWMMGMMWLWMLLPLILIGLLIYALLEAQSRRRA